MEFDKKRKLDNQSLTGSGNLTIRLGLDYEAIKYIDFTLSGAIQTTFASGTPASRAEGPLHQLIPVIRVLRESDAFKAVSPHMLRMQQLLATGFEGSRRGSAAASAASETTVDVRAFPFGTTTQYTTSQDSVRMFMHSPFLKNVWEQRQTWFRTIGLSSASIEFQQNAYSLLQSAANTAPVTYANSTLVVETEVTEAKGISIEDAPITGIAQFKETMKSDSFTAAQSERRMILNQGNGLAAVHMYVKNADAGSSTTATDATADNLAVTNIKVVANNDRFLKQTTFKRLKDENKNRYGYNAPYSSNVAIDDGYVLLNFVHNSNKEAIDTRRGVVDSLDLLFDPTEAGSLQVKIDEITNLPK